MQDADFPTCRGKIRINAGAVEACKKLGLRWLGIHRDDNTA